MRWTELSLTGLFVLDAEPRSDERGSLRRAFCINEFKQHGANPDVKQSNVSENTKKHTLRGFHWRAAPQGEARTMTCIKGRVFDIVIDLRPESPSYLKWVSLELSAENRKSLHIPPGCANAMLTLVDDTWVHYLHSGVYEGPGPERGVRWNDPLFNFKWPAPPAVISEKDRTFPDYVPEKRN